MYRALNYLQYKDGTNMCNINRNDASGYRLDTLTTHHQYRSPTVQGKEILTTHTDYVTPYPSVLQTSCYNFSSTENTRETCVGVVKAHSLFPKNAAQHAADLEMLQHKQELATAFINPHTGAFKAIECARVDGASDEGPSHLEIPSTLNGSCYSEETGKVDDKLLHRNLELATEIYIQRCNGCPCGSTTIHLYKGAPSDQKRREDFYIFLKGFKNKKMQLQRENPSRYHEFEKIWEVRNRHAVTGLPNQYVFYLRCCYQPSCPHALCQLGVPKESLHWYSNGPPLTFFPLPVPNPSRPWGNPNCTECTGTCSGHYLKTSCDLKNIEQAAKQMVGPPSDCIKQAYKDMKQYPSNAQLVELAKKVLLPVEEVEMYIKHLEIVKRNRQRGAAKAAATRREARAKAKQMQATQHSLFGATSSSQDQRAQLPKDAVTSTSDSDGDTLCGVCEKPYQEETKEVEDWIECEKCKIWFHYGCIGIEKEPEQFVCSGCS